MPNVFFKFKPGRLVNTPAGKMVIKTAIHTSTRNSYEVFPTEVAGMGMAIIYCEEILCKYNNGEKEQYEEIKPEKPFKCGQEFIFKNGETAIIESFNKTGGDNYLLLRFKSGTTLWYEEKYLISNQANKNIENEKPPIGLVPKYIWLAKRKEAIREAIFRYIEAGEPLKEEWFKEYNEIIELEIKQSSSNNLKGGK